MAIQTVKAKFLYALAVGVSICLLLFVVMFSWIGYEVIRQCDQAQREYDSDCVESLISVLQDEGKEFRSRNDAIWVLGQLGDARALSVLKHYYTGEIPPREPLDETISQYELRKAINLTSGGPNRLAWLWRRFVDVETSRQSQVSEQSVVIAQRADPYYPLAQKIAAEENARIIEEFADVLELRPKFVILVASPDRLTAEMLATIGYIFENQDYYPAVGIISGSTLASAEQLWARRHLAQEGQNFLGTDVDILQSIYEPSIFELAEGANTKIALNQATLIEALKQADYFYWARHTGPRDWSWNEEYGNWTENDRLLGKDIPALKAAVIYSLTCSPLRPWVENSIALAFVDQGAAAFLGFVNTPHIVTFARQEFALPGITSWRELPLGLVAQIHNRTAAKSVFSSPQLFMLGDPRIFLSKTPPYQIIADTMAANGKRVITGTSPNRTILAVKVAGGAAYDFVSLKGLTSASEQDIFYNNKLQTLNLGADKYLLFFHERGDFTLELAPQASVGWQVQDAFTDALDYSWVVLWLSTYADGNPNIYLFSIPVFVGILLFMFYRRKRSFKDYSRIWIVALALTLLRLAYFWLRADDYTVSANLVDYTALQIALGCGGVFASIAGGFILIRESASRKGKFLGLLFTSLRAFWMTGFYLVFITALNTITPLTRNTQPWLLSYDTFWLSLIPLVLEIAIIIVAYRYLLSDRNIHVRLLLNKLGMKHQDIRGFAPQV